MSDRSGSMLLLSEPTGNSLLHLLVLTTSGVTIAVALCYQNCAAVLLVRLDSKSNPDYLRTECLWHTFLALRFAVLGTEVKSTPFLFRSITVVSLVWALWLPSSALVTAGYRFFYRFLSFWWATSDGKNLPISSSNIFQRLVQNFKPVSFCGKRNFQSWRLLPKVWSSKKKVKAFGQTPESCSHCE